MNEPTEEAREKLDKLIAAHVAQLAEHFQNVTILCSNLEEDGELTYGFTDGVGNKHARLNQAREWVMYNDEKTRARAHRDAFKEDEEEDDDE